MVNTNLEFYLQTRALFPNLAELADKEYVRCWGNPSDTDPYSYSWFESVANALNKEMCRGLFRAENEEFFNYVSSVLLQCGDEVANCIDVALVENLFWRVSPEKAAPYWTILPPPLQKLYLGFHSQPPTS